ncbi:MAG: GGDEF domain-containing protein [Pseudomonadota bacterium]
MSGHVTALQRGFGRQLWLGVLAFVLLIGGLILALRSVQLDRALHERYQNALALAQLSFEVQHLVADLRAGPARPRDPQHALEPAEFRRAIDARLAAMAALPLTPEEHARVTHMREALREAEASASADDDAHVRIDRALHALLAAVRERTELAASDAGRFNDAAQVALAAIAALIAALGAAFAASASRTLAASRRLMGQLDQLAHEDALTGVLNRRGLDERLPVEMARAQRLAYPLTVAMLDFDHFKRFNDRRGHGAGDALLRGTAQAWLRQLRPTDLLARYGGEEFTLVLPACSVDDAVALIERLRPLMPERQTFSAGVAAWNGADPPEALLRTADIALLQAKRAGRNRTVVAGREPQVALPLSTA